MNFYMQITHLFTQFQFFFQHNKEMPPTITLSDTQSKQASFFTYHINTISKYDATEYLIQVYLALSLC